MHRRLVPSKSSQSGDASAAPKSCLDRNNDHTYPALEQGELLPDNGNPDNQTEQTNSIKDNGPDDITPDR